jgi:hypothetical protein
MNHTNPCVWRFSGTKAIQFSMHLPAILSRQAFLHVNFAVIHRICSKYCTCVSVLPAPTNPASPNISPLFKEKSRYLLRLCESSFLLRRLPLGWSEFVVPHFDPNSSYHHRNDLIWFASLILKPPTLFPSLKTMIRSAISKTLLNDE